MLFTLDEARAFEDGTLADKNRYPDALLTEAGERIAEAFAQICGTAFGPVEVVERVSGAGNDLLILGNARVLAVSQVRVRDGSAWSVFDQSQLDDVLILSGGLLRREFGGCWPLGKQNIEVTYAYGYAEVPHEIKRAALKLLCSPVGVLASNLPDRAMSFSDESGTFRLATAGVTRGSFFGIPDVDSVLQRYQSEVIVIA